jgi:hypothetical protein
MERRRGEWDLHANRMDAKKLVKISRDNVPVGRSPRRPKKKKDRAI